MYINVVFIFHFSRELVGTIERVIGIASVVLQFFCIAGITYFKCKYHAEETNQQYGNASFRLNSSTGGNLDVVNEGPQPIFTIGELLATEMGTNRNETTQNTNVPSLCASTSHTHGGNSVTYNKILFEVYHMFFLTVTIILILTQQQVKKSLNPSVVAGIPLAVLYLLDTGPVIMISGVLPLMIYFSNPEIRRYIRGCFCN